MMNINQNKHVWPTALSVIAFNYIDLPARHLSNFNIVLCVFALVMFCVCVCVCKVFKQTDLKQHIN